MLTATINTINQVAADQYLIIRANIGTLKLIRIDPAGQPADSSRPIPADLFVFLDGLQLSYGPSGRMEGGPIQLDFEESTDATQPRLQLYLEVGGTGPVTFKCEVPNEATLDVVLAPASASLITYTRDAAGPTVTIAS